MKARHVDDGDWTITVSEFPLLDDHLGVVKWEPGYWEVRHSAMGEQIAEAVRVNNRAPWLVSTRDGEHQMNDQASPELVLRARNVPDVIIARMQERGLI